MAVLRLDLSQAPAPDQRLMDLGFDSLMAVQLRNQVGSGLGLGKTLPVTLMFDYPTIDAIAHHILARLALDRAGPDGAPPAAGARQARRCRRGNDRGGGRGHAARSPGTSHERPTAELSPLKRAFLALEDAQARLAAAEGAAARADRDRRHGLPLSRRRDDPDAFWRLLRDGVDAIGPVPADRWDVDACYDPDPRRARRRRTRATAAFLDDVDSFDPAFFGISPREAQGMDPQQRLLLEVSWEALEHAGQAPDRLGRQRAPASSSASAAATTPTCSSRPAMPRCSTRTTPRASRTASPRAGSRTCSACRGRAWPSTPRARRRWWRCTWPCQSLRAGECRMALAGGVNLILSPELYDRVLARRACWRPTAAARPSTPPPTATAAARAAASVVLKRLSDAQRRRRPRSWR